MLAITGADGFVGSALCLEAAARGIKVRALTLNGLPCPGAAEHRALGDLMNAPPSRELFDGIAAVIHCAAKVHVMGREQRGNTELFRRINCDGTLALARGAADAGVQRFIFLSTVKVLGDCTTGQPFQADDPLAPVGAYATSKAAAEQGLLDLLAGKTMQLVVVRPPLVYGPGVRANFLSMARWLARGVPLPLGAIRDNRRSLVGLDNLVDLILLCLRHPAAANQIFLAADGEDLSTTDLLRRTASALGVSARLIPVPIRVLKACAALLGKESVIQRLCGSLQVDISKARSLLGWVPPVSVDEGLRRAVQPLISKAM